MPAQSPLSCQSSTCQTTASTSNNNTPDQIQISDTTTNNPTTDNNNFHTTNDNPNFHPTPDNDVRAADDDECNNSIESTTTEPNSDNNSRTSNKNGNESINNSRADQNENTLSTTTCNSSTLPSASIKQSDDELNETNDNDVVIGNCNCSSGTKLVRDLQNDNNNALATEEPITTPPNQTPDDCETDKSTVKSTCLDTTSISISCIPTTGDTENTDFQLTADQNHAVEDVTRDSSAAVNQNERQPYFPIYSPEATPFRKGNDLKSPDMILVQSGSCYPNRNISTSVRRVIYRTESTEAQPSTASTHADATGGEDSDESLVDSLDDGVSPHQKEAIVRYSPSVVKHGESFFVPIANDNTSKVQATIDPNVTISMPDKIRKKLIKRQQTLDEKKCQEMNKKQKKLQKILRRTRTIEEKPSPTKEKSQSTASSGTSASSYKSHSKYAVATSGKGVLSAMKSDRNQLIRGEIGLLQTYTIDAKGNMQFHGPKKIEVAPMVKRNGCKSMPTPKSMNVVKIEKGVVAGAKTKKHSFKVKKNCEMTVQRSSKECIKEVQQMTMYQAADIITPDNECGPKRMYQKTEFCDGEKRVEILEIVECIDSCSSSADSSPGHHQMSSFGGTPSSSHMRIKSKIPIPIGSAQKPIKSGRQSGGSSNTVFTMRNIQNAGHREKVDQMIADLLIDALSQSKDNVECSSAGGPSISSKSKRTTTLTSRRILTQDRIRHSASNVSSKYQQIFDVIPEEKSSLSVDSSNEEGTSIQRDKPSSVMQTNANLNNEDEEQQCRQIISVRKSTKCVQPESEPISRHSRSNGKAAVQSECIEPKAWMGFFKQHDESSVDSGNEGTRIIQILLFVL